MTVDYVNKDSRPSERNYMEVEKKFVYTIKVAKWKVKTLFRRLPNSRLEKLAFEAGADEARRLRKDDKVELNEFDITFMPRRVIKAQAFANFMLKNTSMSPWSERHEPNPLIDEVWELWTNESAQKEIRELDVL